MLKAKFPGHSFLYLFMEGFIILKTANPTERGRII